MKDAYEKAVVTEVTGTVATLTLSRPDSFNSMTPQFFAELKEAVAGVGQNPAIRSVVLTGSGKTFSSGGDLNWFDSLEEPKSRGLSVGAADMHRIILGLRQMPKPVIAAINGSAGGGGFSLAMACDLRLAADTAKFRQAYTSAGLTPDGGWTMFVPRLIGLAKAAELLFLDPMIDAQQALALGLINQVVPAAELASTAAKLAARLAAGPTLAFAGAKALLNQSLLAGLADHLELERLSIAASSDTEDFREGLAAFLAKRSPNFRGR